MTADELISLNEQIAGMARAGLPLDQGLASLASEMSRGRLRRVTEGIVRDLKEGKTQATFPMTRVSASYVRPGSLRSSPARLMARRPAKVPRSRSSSGCLPSWVSSTSRVSWPATGRSRPAWCDFSRPMRNGGGSSPIR